MGDHTLLDKTMMRVWVLLIAAVCIASTVALTTEEEVCLGEGANKPNCAKVQCAQHTHCDTCTKDIRCGWCASDKVCIPGLAASPTKANCTAWDYAFCSSLPCAAHESCDACAADPVCGWCSTSNVCTEGSMRGPDALWLLDSQVNVILRNPGFWNLLALSDLECATGVWILLPCLVTIVLPHPSVLTMVLINVPPC